MHTYVYIWQRSNSFNNYYATTLTQQRSNSHALHTYTLLYHHHRRLVFKRLSVKYPHPCGLDALQLTLISITKSERSRDKAYTTFQSAHCEACHWLSTAKKTLRRTPPQTNISSPITNYFSSKEEYGKFTARTNITGPIYLHIMHTHIYTHIYLHK